ncbi:MAG: energy-coupling factor transporter ATPase [Mogibacterium sp.]|nr:energy-coupling factor transporter ATPase [Mogibacterium sp.]
MRIEARNLKYTYSPDMPGSATALDGVSFCVDGAGIVGIIGHTGSGKSTLLQHLNGLIAPTSGDIFIDGECITGGKRNLTDIRRKIGLVFQYPEYQLFEESVAADVAFGPKNLGVKSDEIEDRVRRAIEVVGLDYEDVKDKSPFELSGGMKRRAAIAGVIAMEPEVLMLDEPTAGLDPAAHRDILAMIKRMQREMEMIILFVSHNMADIAELSDRVIVMSEGKIAMDGTPREVFAERERLTEMGLSLPLAGKLGLEISERLKDFATEALSIDELAGDIERYIKG